MDSDTGVVRTYNDVMQTKLNEEYFMVAGKKEGPYKQYFFNSNTVLFQCNYVNDKLEGACYHYYDNGQLQICRHFVNHSEEGECKEYYKSGLLKYCYTIINGKKTGEFRAYDENGVLTSIYNYATYTNVS